jgi:hypothetical protein
VAPLFAFRLLGGFLEEVSGLAWRRFFFDGDALALDRVILQKAAGWRFQGLVRFEDLLLS